MTNTEMLLDTYKKGFVKGYLTAIEDFKKLTKIDIPEEMEGAWSLMAFLPEEKKHDKNHRNK